MLLTDRICGNIETMPCNKMKSLRIILSSILILIITFAAFAPCLKNGFVNWDDDIYVTDNVVIRHLSLHSIVQIFSTFFSAMYLPMTMLSYMSNYQLSQLDPFGYHMTNLLIHLLNCLLVFWLIRLFSRNILVSFITAILFGVHPLRVESVAWVSERKDVFYSFFLLLSLICYCYYLQIQRRGKAYWLSVVFFIFSLLSKAMAITLPILLLLADYFRGRKYDRKMIADKIPFLILAICFGVFGIYGQWPTLRSEPLLSFFDKFLISSYTVIFYLSKILLPIGLSSLYPYSGIKDISIYLFSLIDCLAILILTICSVKHTRKVVFGILFFLITLLPVLQFVPLGSTIVADRYTYMASLGLFYLIAEVVVGAYKKTAEKNRRLGVGLIIIFLIPIVGSLSVLTWNRCVVWKDGITLWSDVLKINPSAFAYNHRGVLFFRKGEYSKARYDFESAIASDATFISSYNNLGILYKEMGKNNEAIATFEKILVLEPKNTEAYLNIGHVYDLLGRNAEAASFYEKVLRINRDHAVGCYFFGMLSERMGKKDDAVSLLKRALEVNPNDLPSYHALDRLYVEMGRREEQLALYRNAIANDLDYFEAYYAIGIFYQDVGNYRKAIPLFKKAIEINAASAEANTSLGTVYCAIGKNKEALVWLKKALEMNPKIAVAHNNIAVAYYHQKQYDLAIQHCDKAIEMGYKVTPKLLGLLKPFRK